MTGMLNSKTFTLNFLQCFIDALFFVWNLQWIVMSSQWSSRRWRLFYLKASFVHYNSIAFAVWLFFQFLFLKCESWIHSAVWDFTIRSGPCYFIGGDAVKGCLCMVAGRECGEKNGATYVVHYRETYCFTTLEFTEPRPWGFFWPRRYSDLWKTKPDRCLYYFIVLFQRLGGDHPKICLFAVKVTRCWWRR